MYEYPETRRADDVDDYNGIKVADPYRWLEDPDSPETSEWVKAQNEISSKYLEQTAREPIKAQLEKMYNYEKYGCPFKRGNKFFYFHNSGLQNQSVLYSQPSLDAPAEVFVDPNTWSEDGTAAIGSHKFSESGKYYAYGVSRSGSDWNTIEVKDAETGQVLTDRVEWVKFSGIAWTHDDRGFYYARFPAPEDAATKSEDKRGTSAASNLNQEIFYHVLGQPQMDDKMVFSSPENPNWTHGVEVTDDGRYLLITLHEGCDPVNRLFYCDLQQANGTDAPLVVHRLIDNFEAEYSYITNEGTVFYFRNNLKAPKYRVISIDIANPAPENWKEVIPESDDVLSDVSCVNHDKLVVSYMHDVKEVVKIFNLQGEFLSEVALPGIGSLAGFSGRKQDDLMFYKFTSFTYPGTIFVYDFNTQQSKVFRETHIENFVPSDYVTEQVFYKSKDGTPIPMFIVHPKSLQKNGDNLTYLYGYGGFNISLTPSFSVFRLVLLQGYQGVLAIPNLRGGGEYGEDWHRQGTLERKQNVFDDFIGAAQFLISQGYTQPKRIAISGGSNGGLLVGAVVTQRPSLWGAAIAQVGVLDMLRFHKFTIGRHWCSDYGCADKPEDFEYLIKYSPLHNVRKGEEYPPLLLATADHDDRVVPAHSYKFISEVQYQLGKEPYQNNPLLIRIETKAGHGAGKPTSKVLEEVADIYGFIGKATGVEWTLQ